MIRFLFKMYRFLFLPALLLGGNVITAQNAELRGRVLDSLQNSVPHTNIIATPLAEGPAITFAIADAQGRYKLHLRKQVPYKLQLTHLGYAKAVDTVSISENSIRDFILYESSEALEEVTIEAEMAIIVKQDTIIYRTDHFTTGEERKLREVLDKLPGVEVDREGNVSINGKKVTKLLVEGKPFFTGDTKLGVNNIPADAVEEVVALDNYHEVAFLKELSNSDQLALNIKLKEDKKKFAFGEVAAGGGIEERYLLNPTLFYYSERTAMNVIGDLNNTGDRSFTFRDYINFEGGMAEMLQGGSSFSNLFNTDFASFLNQRDFKHSRNEFLAGSISHQLSGATTLDAYTILSRGKVETFERYDISYLTETGLDEDRETATDNEVGFTLNKIKLRIRPDSGTDIAYNALVKTSSGDAFSDITSRTAADIFSTQTQGSPNSAGLVQDLRFHKRFSYKHTSTLTAHHRFSDSENSYDWLFDRKPFSGIIPFVDDGGRYNLLQQTASKGNDFNLNLKHYWVLNNLNHLYPELGMNFVDQEYATHDFQRLEDGSDNRFFNSGFDNELGFKLLDLYAGFEYKFKKGDFTFKPGLMYHHYRWSVNEYDRERVEETKGAFLPSLEVDWDVGPSEKMELNYHLKSSFSDASQYATRLRLSGYNQLFRGNGQLENELLHSASLRYRKFNLYRGIIINSNLSYTKKTRSVQNATLLEGIDRISSPLYSDLPETNYGFRGSLSKRLGDFELSAMGNVSVSEYSRQVNGAFFNYESQNYIYELKGETSFKKWPNFELGVEQRFNNFQSEASENKFTEVNPFAYVEYDFWEDFIFKADYTYSLYSNKVSGEENHFQMGNVSLYYSRENSLWGFELEARNVFDIRYRNANSLSQFMLTDQKIYVQPRMLLFKVTYKI